MRPGVSRRSLLLAAAGAAPLLTLASTRAEAKIPQTAVAYQDQPNGDKECDNCTFFVAPNACKTVDGEINPKGWCKIYSKKAAS
jgi:hypothetical protein